MMRFRILLLFVILSFIGVYGQIDRSYAYNYPEFKSQDENALLLQIENHNFFKNNEYSGDYIEGYTLTGYDLAPSLIYYPSSKIRLQAGLQMQKFSGIESYTSVVPILSAHAKLADSLHLIIGRLSGHVQHEMLEPIFDSERLYTDPVENGIQFLYSNNWMKGDVWVNWEQFIFGGDTIPEIFTFGLSTKLKMVEFNNSQLSIPFQLTANHRGGQISNYPDSMLSLINGAVGLSFETKPTTGFIKRMEYNAHYLWFKDLTKKMGLPFTEGWALYPTIVLQSTHMQLMGGYFYGNNFASPRGSSLFQSVSDYNPVVYSKERQLLTGKFSYQHMLAKGVNISALVDVYYDLPASQLDYAFGVSLFVNPQFFLGKVALK